MIKSLSAFGILALLATSVVVLPGFAPMVEAREPAALAKADRLDLAAAPAICGQQVWPNLTPSCLRGASNTAIREARLVTAKRP